LFATTSYKEGQYMFVNAPAVSFIQWHPFTISSAPQEKTITIHIRTCGAGSWTQELCDYILKMGQQNVTYFSLDRPGPFGKEAGKVLGPDGNPILRIDAPHSAPTQHVGEYNVVMVIGAGIGVTPVSSTLKSIVYFKWKFGLGNCYPDHAYFVWLCSYRDINAFRWLIRIIKDAQDEVVHMRAHNSQQMANKTFQVHIYITSVPSSRTKPQSQVEDEIGFWGKPYLDEKEQIAKTRARFSSFDLYQTMLNPPAHAQLEDIHVYNGRPKWEQRFGDVARVHPTEEIGVAFCGNPQIAKDLRDMCHFSSRGRTQGIFKLHKENF